jgi:hypothetical protein
VLPAALLLLLLLLLLLVLLKFLQAWVLLLAALAHLARPNPHHHPLRRLLQSQSHHLLSSPPGQRRQQQPSCVCSQSSQCLGAHATVLRAAALWYACLQQHAGLQRVPDISLCQGLLEGLVACMPPRLLFVLLIHPMHCVAAAQGVELAGVLMRTLCSETNLQH